MRRPRIGLYKSFVPNIDEGWTRWLLEQFEFDYASVGNREIHGGGLRQRFDVLVFADQSASSIENGYRAGSMPEEFCGGLGEKGAESLRQFAADGGTLVFLNDSGSLRRTKAGAETEGRRRGRLQHASSTRPVRC